MSARKDFFYLKGHESVKNLEYLNWRELLHFAGAVRRRRDRVLSDPLSVDETQPKPPNADPTKLFGAIHREMLACLRVADLCRQQYAKGGAAAEGAIRTVCARAEQAVRSIYAAASASSS
ncbi:MAG: hypothetical protein QM775_28875 [Pirellulales bacterium]